MPIHLHTSQMGENRQANQQTKTGADVGKILTDFLDEGRSRKLLGGVRGKLRLEIFWISKSFSQSLAIGQFPFPWMKPCKSADYFISRFQLGKFFVVIENIFIMTNLTDFRRTV